MEVIFDKSFFKSLDKLRLASLKSDVLEIIIQVEKAKSLADIPKIKKLTGYKTFYRIKTGDYRLGFEIEEGNIIRFILVSHRKDIYKVFP